MIDFLILVASLGATPFFWLLLSLKFERKKKRVKSPVAFINHKK